MFISIQKSNQLKAIAVLMMLFLHLFNNLDYESGLYHPLLFIGQKPLVYYMSFFTDACVPIFAFVSGYGLYFKYQKNSATYVKDNFLRLKKLYINYWVIILIFPVAIGLILKFPEYPGSFWKFLSNTSGLDSSYNGAWWFFTIYLLFVVTSKLWFDILEKLNPYLYLGILFIVYVLFFKLRLSEVWKGKISSDFAETLVKDFVFFFCTLFQFLLGAFALKFKWNTMVAKIFENVKYKNTILVILILGLVIVHALIPNFIIAPFTGLCFIMLFNQLNLNKYVVNFLDFLSPHCTNMWLIHMFFYLIFFPDFIYSFQYPIVIFFVLVLLCVLSSYIINFFYNRILKIIQ